MKAIRYTQSFFAVGELGHSEEKFKKGQTYPVTPESEKHVRRGIAEVVEVEDPPAAEPEASAEAARDTAAEAAAPAADQAPAPDAAPEQPRRKK